MGGDNSHVRQRTRIIALRFCSILFLLCVLSFQPASDGTQFGTMLSIAGSTLVIVSVLGRYWSIKHIRSRKNVILVQTGPYSCCRNPLYFFSFLLALGCGLISKSIVLTIVFSLSVLYIFLKVIQKEERYLSCKFGEEYELYRAQVPRIIPGVSASMRRSFLPDVRDSTRQNRQLVETFSMLLLIPLVHMVKKIRDTLQLDVLVLI
ncbi:MAG: isoprenylcysteine carboxylmethyltransferase family protein [Alphaproteobacteria bacterium]|nr:isoprenylcysteine carboxylmethyltransferase family protein [Alphaproteobacteria bacterium]